MNDETHVHSTPYRCPECDGPIRLEFTRPVGGGDVTSETYECRDCGKSFELSHLQGGLSGCDHCGTMQEGVEAYLVYFEITAEEKSMKLCPACFGRREESGIKIIRQLS